MTYLARRVEELSPGDVLKGPEAFGTMGRTIKLPDPTILDVAMVGNEVYVRHTGFDDDKTPCVLRAERGDVFQIRSSPPSSAGPTEEKKP